MSLALYTSHLNPGKFLTGTNPPRALSRHRRARGVASSVLESQSSPSYKPSPATAQDGRIYHWLSLSPFRPSLSTSSELVMEFGRSILLAKVSTTASLNSSSATH